MNFSEMLFNQGCQMNRIAEKAYVESSATSPAPEAAVESPKARDEVTVELLVALCEIIALVGDREGMGDLGGTPDAYLLSIRQVARAAISRAEKA